MAKKVYIGVGGKAKQVKKIYFGVGGKARRVKKAYIGIGGVARPFWSDGVDYYGEITSLRYGKYNLGATSLGDYALFGGGYGTDKCTATVDAYNTSLTRKAATDFSQARCAIKATTVGNYALFGSGWYYDNGIVRCNTVDAYDKSLTKVAVSNLSTPRSEYAAVSIENYAIFGGGFESSASELLSIVETYNASLTKSTAPNLSPVKTSLGAASVGNYAIFNGGYNGTTNLKGTAYNKSLTRTIVSACRNTGDAVATGIENYAMFHTQGYYTGGSYYHGLVDAYNASLTRVNAPDFSEDKQDLAAVTVNGIAMFGGGVLGGDADGNSKSVDSYDASLTRTQLQDLSKARYNLSAAKVGNYALFAGGYSTTYEKIVDAYIVP